MVSETTPATNTASKFKPFSLTLSTGATITGISHIPTRSTTPTRSLPLLVGIHGGTCTAYNYDIAPSYTASLSSSALGVPFVAFNRPCYAGSTEFLIPEASTFHRSTGEWEHNLILPALWAEFGQPNGCTGMVLTCHSMAVPGAIVAAAMWAKESTPSYPLAGLIFSGWGAKLREHEGMDQPPPAGQLPPPTLSLRQYKALMMGSEAEHAAYDPALEPLMLAQDVPIPLMEVVDGRGPWFQYGPGYAKDVNVPIMYAMGEKDWLWEGGSEYIPDFQKWFPNCPRFDGSSVLGAPHALEWSWVSQGWYARCFGFAMEVCEWRRA